jgi:hypothetical protein
MESYSEDVFQKIVKPWPLPRVIRPSVRSLVKVHTPELPELLPLDPKLITDSEENANELDSACKALQKVEKEYEVMCTELEGLEKGNRWNNRSNRDVRIQQITKDMAVLKQKKEDAKGLYDKILKNGESLSYLINSHKNLEESYERLRKMQEVMA